jgi:outer membrane protein assembly factor BamA
VGISTPRLYPFASALRGGVDLIHERANRLSYTLTKYSGQVTVDTVQRRPLSAGFTVELGTQTFADTRKTLTDVIPLPLLRQPEGDMVFSSLRPVLTLDLRDVPGRTRSGFFAQVTGDYMKSLTPLSFQTNILRVQAVTAGYMPLPFNSSLLLSARGGYIFHFDQEKKTPPDRRFYLGGATTLRGFSEDSLQPEDVRKTVQKQIRDCQNVVAGLACTPGALQAIQGQSIGGELMVALRAEARVFLGGSWELALFYDRGNLLSDTGAENIQWRDLLNPHHAVGSGVRYATPIGRMALDVGVNLNPDDTVGEKRWGLYFSIDTL